ncbi:MAG: C-type lectin domain-containing protein, partial [Lachnospiraceae bacterium]|nr:C-type lectin domain-containing protein [Lachnospiraceae bacterium]
EMEISDQMGSEIGDSFISDRGLKDIVNNDIDGASDSGSNDSKDSAGESDTSWAEDYYQYLENLNESINQSGYSGMGSRTFGFIYVNNDEIPELLIYGDCEATGNVILTWNDGVISDLQTSRLYFTYIEKGNLLNNCDGHMGYYYDYIYTIENGNWKQKDQGEYYVEDNSMEWDDDDLIYSWNGETVDKNEYERKLRESYDSDNAKEGISPIMGYEEMQEKLESIFEGGDYPYLEDDVAIHRYEVIQADLTWEEAAEDCRRRGGYLVRINSYSEENEIEELLKRNNQEKLVIWLGGRLNPADGHYHWFDGEKYGFKALEQDPDTQYNWLKGEPSFKGKDNKGNTVDENYMCMFRVDDMWQWNDVPLDLSPYYPGRIAYICEYE